MTTTESVSRGTCCTVRAGVWYTIQYEYGTVQNGRDKGETTNNSNNNSIVNSRLFLFLYTIYYFI